MSEVVSACPLCGAYSGAALARPPALLAVCDVLVVRALENIGKRIVRAERDRFAMMGGRPWHVAHTIWVLPDPLVTKALEGAWDVVPAMLDSHGCCGVTTVQVTGMLDRYVRLLVNIQREHALENLKVLFEATLGLSVAAPEPYLA